MSLLCSVGSALCCLFLVYLVIRAIVKISAGRCESPVCLVGKTAIVTGGNQGLGYETALALAGRGCKVIIADKANSEESVKKIKQHTNNTNVCYKYIDLGSFRSVRQFAKECYENEERLDILFNCAGFAATTESLTEDKVNLGMQVNHFGPFLLTHLLIDLLKKSAPSRIVFVSSLMSYIHDLDEKTLLQPSNNVLTSYNYSNSKLCNIISADGFAERLKNTGVTSNAVHPGLVKTNIFANVSNKYFIQKFFIIYILNPIFTKNVREGAQTGINAAVSKKLENTTGKFFVDCRPFPKPKVAYDKEFCERIWKISEQIVKITPEEKL